MKISGPSPLRTVANVKKKSDRQGSVEFGSFLSEGDEAASAGGAAETSAASPLDGLLFMQEMPDEELRRKKALAKGRLTLDALEQLRHNLLLGEVPFSTLQRLEGLVKQQREAFDDPRLLAILDEIEVRAAVELAKLEMAQGRVDKEI